MREKKYSIAASLEYGRYFSKLWLAFFYFALGLSIIIIPLIIFTSIYSSKYGILIILFMPFLLIFSSLYVIIFRHKLSVQIKLWLEDAIELNARSIEIGSYQYSVGTSRVNKRKIQISFDFNGKRIIKSSGKPGYEKVGAHNTKAGYEGIFRKFANRSIRILYSEKYDQVLILND